MNRISLGDPWYCTEGGGNCLSCHKLCVIIPPKQLTCVLLVQYISINKIKGTNYLKQSHHHFLKVVQSMFF